MADGCSFCGSTAGPFSKVEGLFTVLMCTDCQATRGRGSGPYPVMTRAEMRAGLDLIPTWALEQKAAANVEPYIRADGTRIWSLMQLERQLRPELYGRRRGGYLDRRQRLQ
jgi:hypothetical protein